MKINFVKAMVFPTLRQVNRVISEFDKMADDLEEDYIFFEYYKRINDHHVYEYVLNVAKTDKEKFNKRIDFILDMIKRNGGF